MAGCPECRRVRRPGASPCDRRSNSPPPGCSVTASRATRPDRPPERRRRPAVVRAYSPAGGPVRQPPSGHEWMSASLFTFRRVRQPPVLVGPPTPSLSVTLVPGVTCRVCAGPARRGFAGSPDGSLGRSTPAGPVPCEAGALRPDARNHSGAVSVAAFTRLTDHVDGEPGQLLGRDDRLPGLGQLPLVAVQSARVAGRDRTARRSESGRHTVRR